MDDLQGDLYMKTYKFCLLNNPIQGKSIDNWALPYLITSVSKKQLGEYTSHVLKIRRI